MAVVIPIEHHPHSAHDRTKEWNSCCYEIAMGRDPKRQRLMVHDDGDSFFDDDCNNTNDLNNVLGCWSSPDYLAINMIEEHEEDDDDMHAHLDSWMKAACTLSQSIDEVSNMIQRKAASYVSSTDTLSICFNSENGGGLNAEQTMTNADRSILETTIASFAAGMAKQIESLRQTVVVEGDHPFMKSADNGNTDTASAPQHNWASGPIGHRAGIASCLMQRLKAEIMDPMTKLQSQRGKSLSNSKSGNDYASDIAQNPMRLLRLGTEDIVRCAMPPAPWEVGEHNPEKDRGEREQEENEFINVYFNEGGEKSNTSEDVNTTMTLPPSVTRLLDLPKPSPAVQQQYQPNISKVPTIPQTPQQNIIHSHQYQEEEEEEHIDQLQRESATLLATYQHSDLEGVQKVERSMVEITSVLSRFTDLITEQQEDIFQIHDQALKSKENVNKGQDQLVDAANRGEKSKHPMATFIFVMALLMLFFNWILP